MPRITPWQHRHPTFAALWLLGVKKWIIEQTIHGLPLVIDILKD